MGQSPCCRQRPCHLDDPGQQQLDADLGYQAKGQYATVINSSDESTCCDGCRGNGTILNMEPSVGWSGDRNDEYPEPEYDNSTLCDKPEDCPCSRGWSDDPHDNGDQLEKLPEPMTPQDEGCGLQAQRQWTCLCALVFLFTMGVTWFLKAHSPSANAREHVLSARQREATTSVVPVLLPLALPSGGTTWEPVPVAVPRHIPATVCAGDIRRFPPGKQNWCCTRLGIKCNWLASPTVSAPPATATVAAAAQQYDWWSTSPPSTAASAAAAAVAPTAQPAAAEPAAGEPEAAVEAGVDAADSLMATPQPAAQPEPEAEAPADAEDEAPAASVVEQVEAEIPDDQIADEQIEADDRMARITDEIPDDQIADAQIEADDRLAESARSTAVIQATPAPTAATAVPTPVVAAGGGLGMAAGEEPGAYPLSSAAQ